MRPLFDLARQTCPKRQFGMYSSLSLPSSLPNICRCFFGNLSTSRKADEGKDKDKEVRSIASTYLGAVCEMNRISGSQPPRRPSKSPCENVLDSNDLARPAKPRACEDA